MRQQFEDVSRESPRASKVLVVLFSGLIAFVVLALGWQQWVYSQQRTDIKETAIRQETMITTLTTKQDLMWNHLSELKKESNAQNVEIAKAAEKLDRYNCDLKDLKDTMKGGFEKLSTKFENLELRKR
jgi:predicted negative regulator of RcsB-dependent stress response